MNNIYGKTRTLYLPAIVIAFVMMATLLAPANAFANSYSTSITGKDGKKNVNSAIQLDLEMMALIDAMPEEVAEDDPSKTKSKQIFTITDLTDLTQLPSVIMGRKTPQNTYNLKPAIFNINPLSVQSFKMQLQTKDGAPATVTIYDDNGSRIKKMNVKNPDELQELVLETGALEKGTYFIEVSQGLQSCYKIIRKNY